VLCNNIHKLYFSKEWKSQLLQVKIMKSVAIYRGTALKIQSISTVPQNINRLAPPIYIWTWKQCTETFYTFFSFFIITASWCQSVNNLHGYSFEHWERLISTKTSEEKGSTESTKHHIILGKYPTELIYRRQQSKRPGKQNIFRASLNFHIHNTLTNKSSH